MTLLANSSLIYLAARNAIPANVWELSGKENGCWKIGPAFGNALDFLLQDRHCLRTRRPPYRPPIFNPLENDKKRPKSATILFFLVIFFQFLCGSAMFFCPVECCVVLKPLLSRIFFSCSFNHLDFVKEFPHFGRKLSAKIG